MAANGNPTCCAGPLTVQSKLHAILDGDQDSHGFIGRADDFPQLGPDGNLGEWERDLLEWGAVYGLAFGIARAENPWEREESVAERAVRAAWPVYFDRWGEFASRDIDPAVREVVGAFQAARRRGGLPRELAELDDALIGLMNAAGS